MSSYSASRSFRSSQPTTWSRFASSPAARSMTCSRCWPSQWRPLFTATSTSRRQCCAWCWEELRKCLRMVQGCVGECCSLGSCHVFIAFPRYLKIVSKVLCTDLNWLCKRPFHEQTLKQLSEAIQIQNVITLRPKQGVVLPSSPNFSFGVGRSGFFVV